MGPVFFAHKPKPGKPLCMRGLANGLARLEHALRSMTVHNGRVDWHGFEPKIILDNADELLKGKTPLIAFVNGKPYVSSTFPTWATPVGSGNIADWPSDDDFGFVAGEAKACWLRATLSASGDYDHIVAYESGSTFPEFADTNPESMSVWRPITMWSGYAETRLSSACISIFVP